MTECEVNSKKVIVRHSIGTSEEQAPNGAYWIDFWCEKTKKTIPNICPSCNEPPNEENKMVGAHVEEYIQLAEPKQNKTYFITPTCKKCNDTYKGHNHYHKFSVEESDLLPLDGTSSS